MQSSESTGGLKTFDYEPIVLDHSVGYEFGLEFGIRPVSLDKKEQQLIEVQKNKTERRTFVGLFNQNDTDFEIFVKNNSEHKIGFRFIFNGNVSQRTRFVLDEQSDWILKTLKDEGHHFHFVSQETDEGKMLVAMNAKKQKVSYAEAAVGCSRIEIEVELAKTHEEYEHDQKVREKEKFRRILKDKNFTIVLKLSYKIFFIETDSTCTIKNFKTLIEKKVGIPSHLQILKYDDNKQLHDDQSFSDFNIKHADILHVERDWDKEERFVVEKVHEDRSHFIVIIRSKDGFIPIETDPSHTVEFMKTLIQKKIGTPVDRQRLIFGAKHLWDDYYSLAHYNIQHGSILELCLPQMGGGGPMIMDFIEDQHLISSEQSEHDTESDDSDKIGARGVICFGAKTDQRFSPYKGTFVASKTLTAHSFVLELRMKRSQNSAVEDKL